MIDSKILHRKFVKLGMMRHKLMNKMLAILPDIYKSGIYKKYAGSIFEYASKFGGISQSAVEKRLRLEKHLVDKPALRGVIKDVGVNKVSMVATIATVDTDAALADKLKNMSSSAVATMSKELRCKADPTSVSPCGAKGVRVKIDLDEEMSFLFLKLKKKWGKHMSNKEVMAKILSKMIDDEFPAKKMLNKNGKIVKTVKNGKLKPAKVVIDDGLPDNKKDVTRYISADRKRKILAKTDGKCEYPGCNKPAENNHHTDRFMDNKSHESIRALCKDHHEFPHNGLIKNEKDDPKNWKMTVKGVITHEADKLYRKYRQEALL